MSVALKTLPKIDYASHPAYGGMFEPDPALGEQARRLLEPLIEEMRAAEAQRVEQFGYRYGYEDAAGEELVRRGLVVERLPGGTIDKVEAVATPYVTAMRERLAEAKASGAPIKFSMVNNVLDEARDAELYGAVNAAMTETGALERVRVFYGAKSSKLNSVAVFVNPEGQSWSDPLRDYDAEPPPTAGMHIDSNGKCYIKAILYLNDVGPEQGPTCVVPGSHGWETGSQERIIRRAYDRSKLLGRSALDRRMFLSLPDELQLKAEFGGDLLPDNEETQGLLAEEVVSTGERGTYTMFDPETVHRGGAVRAGERIALQITMRPRF